MALNLASTSAFEVSHTSLAIVLALGASVIVITLMGMVRAYFMLRKKREEVLRQLWAVERELQREHLSASSELTVQRKSGGETVKLPQHYTANAADALLELLAQ